MASQIRIFGTAEESAEYFTSLLALCIGETPGDRAFSLVLSGGSTPKMIFRTIASCANEKIAWNRVNIFWGDERCVGPEDGESNFKMAKENLLDLIPVPGSNYFRIQGESDPVTEAERYSSIFKQEVDPAAGIPQADFIMLGLGEDGHTASIFPGNLDLFNSIALFTHAKHPETGQKRITATGQIINNAKRVVIVATGESKAFRVAQIINRLEGWEQLPAAHVKPENGELIWLLDNQAASKL